MRRSCASMATTQLCLRHDFYSRRWPTQAPSDMLKSKRINQTISACVLAAAIGGIGPSVDGAGGLGAGSAGSRRGFRRNHFLRAVKPFSVTRKAGRNGPRAASAVIGQTMRFDHVRVVEPDLPGVLQSPLARDPTAVFGRLAPTRPDIPDALSRRARPREPTGRAPPPLACLQIASRVAMMGLMIRESHTHGRRQR